MPNTANTVSVAVTLLLALLEHLREISSVIAEATGTGNQNLSADQWARILASDDKARAALTAAILAGVTPPPPPTPAPSPPPPP